MKPVVPTMFFEIINGELWCFNFDYNLNEFVWSKFEPGTWG